MAVELLAPVADFETCLAAVHNGADAIYVGAPFWNARGRSPDLSLKDLQEIIEFCRLQGVRTLLAMNVLVFEQELRALGDYLNKLLALQPDALIIQDIGLAQLIRQLCPQQALHASTQMTLASAEAIRALEPLHLRRVVLARELDLHDLQTIRSQSNMELEVFVHGALCVSYSGQCLTSESFGGRSANRGQCAQSCRLPYRLWVDGVERDLEGREYLFSPQDLNALPVIHELVSLGIDAFKIEGRLKSPEYVAAVTRAYRRAIDTGHWDSKDVQILESIYSRGFFTGWLQGTNHQQLVGGFYSSHQGTQLGTVSKLIKQKNVWQILVRTDHEYEIEPGDGVVMTPPGVTSTEENSLGGRVYEVTQESKNLLRLGFSHQLNLKDIGPGYSVWKNDSPALEKELRRSFTDRSLLRKVSIQMILKGNIGQPLQLELSDSENRQVRVLSDQILEKAHQKTPDFETQQKQIIQEELSALGGTIYKANSITLEMESGCFIPQKVLRTLRRQGCEALNQKRLNRPKQAIQHIQFPQKESHSTSIQDEKPLLNIVLRREEQLNQLSPDLAISHIILDFDWGRKTDKALQYIRDLGYQTGLATLRIHRSGENKALQDLLTQQPDLILVRNLGSWQWLREKGYAGNLLGDHSLNITNSLAAEFFLKQKMNWLHPSWDLNKGQLFDLINSCGGKHLEAGLHLYMPTFHMEHCVFAARLSTGSHFPDCGLPCMRHQVEVQDHKGQKHLLQADAECRNTMYLNTPQTTVKLFSQFLQSGIRRFRVEMLNETDAMVLTKLQTYTQVIQQQITPEQAFKQLGILEKVGITEGQLNNQTQWINRKKKVRKR